MNFLPMVKADADFIAAVREWCKLNRTTYAQTTRSMWVDVLQRDGVLPDDTGDVPASVALARGVE
jgi:hypothetical protein